MERTTQRHSGRSSARATRPQIGERSSRWPDGPTPEDFSVRRKSPVVELSVDACEDVDPALRGIESHAIVSASIVLRTSGEPFRHADICIDIYPGYAFNNGERARLTGAMDLADIPTVVAGLQAIYEDAKQRELLIGISVKPDKQEA